MHIPKWLRVWIVGWILLLTACAGGGTTVAVDPGSPALPQGDFALGISGST